jgi:hypothetical protein
MTGFESALISFPNDDADSIFQATPAPIGWKRNGNFFPKSGLANGEAIRAIQSQARIL